MASDKSQTTEAPDDRDPLDAPIGWIPPSIYQAAIVRMNAYRRQLIANGIKPDLETYRSE